MSKVAMAHDSRLFASSPEAGEAEMQPLTDGNPMVSPSPASKTPYGASKYLGEIACQHAVEGADVRIVRHSTLMAPDSVEMNTVK